MKKLRTPSPRIPAKPLAPPNPREPTYDDLLAIVRLIESGSRFSEFRLRSGDIEVDIRRANGAAAQTLAPAQAPSLDPGPPASGSPGQAPPSRAPGMTAVPAVTPAPDKGVRGQAAAGAPLPDVPAGTLVIRSPMVGTFYRASDPNAPPFVEPGTRVAPDTILCIIEVMKLMNSVTAGIPGVVTHVFVENAAMVEFGQPLIAIRPQA